MARICLIFILMIAVPRQVLAFEQDPETQTYFKGLKGKTMYAKVDLHRVDRNPVVSATRVSYAGTVHYSATIAIDEDSEDESEIRIEENSSAAFEACFHEEVYGKETQSYLRTIKRGSAVRFVRAKRRMGSRVIYLDVDQKQDGYRLRVRVALHFRFQYIDLPTAKRAVEAVLSERPVARR